MTTMTKLLTALLAGSLTLAFSLRARQNSAGQTAHASPSPERSACDDWYEKFSDMPPEHRDALKRNGVVFRSGHFLLSEELVPDCELRGRMSSYFTGVFSITQDGDHNRKFAATHSKEIVGVLRRIWPTLGDKKALIPARDEDIADPDEKYTLLGDPALEESDLAPFISDIVKTESISNRVAQLLFARPMQAVKPALLDLQKDAEEADDFRLQILNLAVLQKMGDQSALPKLRKLRHKKELPQPERRYVNAILSKAGRGKEILFSDVEGLEYEDTVQGSPEPH